MLRARQRPTRDVSTLADSESIGRSPRPRFVPTPSARLAPPNRIRRPGDDPGAGGTTDTEAWILAVLARDARRLFEFGTCTGKTAYLWARNQPPGGTVTTLTLAPEQAGLLHPEPGDDPVALAHAEAESQFSRFLYTGTEAEGRIEQLYGDSKQFNGEPYAECCDVVFVDGSHAYSYVVSDSAMAMRMTRPGGLVLWHDYSPECPGVFRALNELATRFPLVHVQGTTLVAWRRQ